MKSFYAFAAGGLLLSFAGVLLANSSPIRAMAPSATNGALVNTVQEEHYTGKIVLLNGSLYILRDDESQTWYHLDDQLMPAKFLGKMVVITGQLEASSNMILVRDIEPADGQSAPGF